MKLIKELVCDIHDELEGAEHYAKKAALYKDTEKAVADNYARMAEAELGHVNSLHEQAVRIIKDYRAAGNEPPTAMQAVWDYEHEQQIDKVASVKMLLSMYRS